MVPAGLSPPPTLSYCWVCVPLHPSSTPAMGMISPMPGPNPAPPPSPFPLHSAWAGFPHLTPCLHTQNRPHPHPHWGRGGGLSGDAGSLLRQRELQDPLQLLFLLARPALGLLLLPRRQRHGQAQLLRVAGEQGAGPPATAPRGRADRGLGGRRVLGSPGGWQGLSRGPCGTSTHSRFPRGGWPDLTNLSPRRLSCDMGWVPGLLLVSASQMVTCDRWQRGAWRMASLPSNPKPTPLP